MTGIPREVGIAILALVGMGISVFVVKDAGGPGWAAAATGQIVMATILSRIIP
jgi:hypothetical protein